MGLIARHFCIGVMVVVIAHATSFSAAGPHLYSKYPAMVSVFKYGTSVWFSGSWMGRVLVVETDPSHRWSTYVCPIGFRLLQTAVQRGSKLIYPGESMTAVFDCQSRKWDTHKGVFVDTTTVGKGSLPLCRTLGPDIVVRHGEREESYRFPLPSFNSVRYELWMFPGTPDGTDSG